MVELLLLFPLFHCHTWLPWKNRWQETQLLKTCCEDVVKYLLMKLIVCGTMRSVQECNTNYLLKQFQWGWLDFFHSYISGEREQWSVKCNSSLCSYLQYEPGTSWSSIQWKTISLQRVLGCSGIAARAECSLGNRASNPAFLLLEEALLGCRFWSTAELSTLIHPQWESDIHYFVCCTSLMMGLSKKYTSNDTHL